MREKKFAMRIDDLTRFLLPRKYVIHITIMSFHDTMFFLYLFPPLSVENFDSPKASPGELTFPVIKDKSMAKAKKNVKAGAKKRRATPLLERPVENVFSIFEDDSAPTETPAARSPEGDKDLGLVALFGEGAANDALLDSSDDDAPSNPDPAPKTPEEATTPAPSASDSEEEAMEVDKNDADIQLVAQPATGGQTNRMTASIATVTTTSREVALQVELGVSTMARRMEEKRRGVEKMKAKRAAKRKSTASTSNDGAASISREVAPKQKRMKTGREPLLTGAFSDARSRLDAVKGNDPNYVAERRGRLEAMRRGDMVVKVDLKKAKPLPRLSSTNPPTKKLEATRKAPPATPSAAPRPMAASANPTPPHPIPSSSSSEPLPSTSSAVSPTSAKGTSQLPRPSKRFQGKEPGVMGSDEVLRGRDGGTYTLQLVERGRIWQRENEEARKKLEALEKEIVATEKRGVISQEQMDIAEEDWNLFFHGTRAKPLKLQRALKQAKDNQDKGLFYTPWRSGPHSDSSGKGKGKGPGKGRGKGK